jgi:hypothetical protein
VQVAGRILRAEQELVADVGAEVDAEVAVGDVDAVAIEIPAGRRRHVVHLVT